MTKIFMTLTLTLTINMYFIDFKSVISTQSICKNKIILDECSTVVEIDHVRGRKTVLIGKMDDIWIDLYAYDDTGCDRLLAMTGQGP